MINHVAVPVPGGTASLQDFLSESPANVTLAVVEPRPVGRLFWCLSLVLVSEVEYISSSGSNSSGVVNGVRPLK